MGCSFLDVIVVGMREAPRLGGVTWLCVTGSSITLGRVVQTGDPAKENIELELHCSNPKSKFNRNFNETNEKL